MTGIDEYELTIAVEDAEKHCGIAANVGVFAEKAIDVVEDLYRVCVKGHAGKSALEHCGKQCGAEAFAGNISDQDSRAVVA